MKKKERVTKRFIYFLYSYKYITNKVLMNKIREALLIEGKYEY